MLNCPGGVVTKLNAIYPIDSIVIERDRLYVHFEVVDVKDATGLAMCCADGTFVLLCQLDRETITEVMVSLYTEEISYTFYFYDFIKLEDASCYEDLKGRMFYTIQYIHPLVETPFM